MLPSLESLQCFERAARLLNFRKAARAVGLTPAAFGQRIQRLEDQLGVKLFVRTTRTVHLTEAGLSLLEPAERCLRVAEETLRVARGDKAPPPMDLVLGTRQELGLSWILPQLDRLEKARPWLQLHLYFGSGPDLLLRVRTMEIDCAVTSSRFSDPKLDALRLHREDYVFCGSSDLLRRKPLVKADDAKRHNLLDTSPEVPLFRYWKDAPRGGDRLRFARGIWLGSIEAIRQRMLDGIGVGVLPEYLVRDDLKSGRLRRILPTVQLLHDYFRLVFRSDDPRRHVFESLTTSLIESPLQ
jgi:LysR family transcriptional regulator, glycine cleavage system transcriptional activator